MLGEIPEKFVEQFSLLLVLSNIVGGVDGNFFEDLEQSVQALNESIIHCLLLWTKMSLDVGPMSLLGFLYDLILTKLLAVLFSA